MQTTKCLGRNDKNLPFEEFKRLFILECQKEGQIVSLRIFNGNICAAEVIKR